MLNRIFININDIMVLTGMSKSGSWHYMRKIKKSLKKEKHQKISIAELAAYEGISESEIKKALNIEK